MFRKRRVVLCAALLFTSLVAASILWADSLANPYQLAHRGAERNNLLPVWLEFQARRNEYLASPELRVLYISAAGWVHSYLGEYRSAFAMAALERKPQPAEDDPELRRALEEYHPVDALEAIAGAARDRRVVMINEEHRDPSHRAFTTELLPILRRQGFRYLGAEAFPSTFDAAQYPRVSGGSTDDAGFTNDPVFGDMIRRAKELGFTFVSYEMDPHCGPGPQTAAGDWLANYGACIERREQGQARNLARFLETHPAAKLVVHAGGGHIQKMRFDFGPMMAWNFRKLTQIDPLSIDQIYMTERSEPAMEELEYQMIAPKYADRTAPFVLRSRDGFFRPRAAEGVDIAVIHPRAVYENGRPTWLSTGGWRKPSPIAQLPPYQAAVPALQRAGTTLLQVFLITDGPDAVPVDQFLITEPLKPAVPMLPDGKYRLRVVDRDGKALAAFNLKVP